MSLYMNEATYSRNEMNKVMNKCLKLEAENEILKAKKDHYLAQYKKARLERKKLRECVEFYADIDREKWDGNENILIIDDFTNCGKRARQTLKDIDNA